MVQISLIRSKCIGCGYCVQISPDYWFIDNSDGKANLYDGNKRKNDIVFLNIPDFEYENQLEVKESCPVNVIDVKKF